MRTTILLAALAAVFAAPAALADDDHGRGHGKGHEKDHDKGHGHKKHKEEFWDGPCKVTREWKKDGEYKEKRKCKGGDHDHGHEGRQVRVVPAPPPQRVVVVPPWMVQQQGETIYRPQYRPAPVTGVVRCNSQVVGSVLGGIVGGALGSQIGKGDGRTLATIGGAVAGVLVGGDIGRRMDAANQACVGEVLEVAPAGRRVQWAQGPVTYAAVPGQVAYRQGAYCRPYTLEMRNEAGRIERTRGTACRRPDGVWIAG